MIKWLSSFFIKCDHKWKIQSEYNIRNKDGAKKTVYVAQCKKCQETSNFR